MQCPHCSGNIDGNTDTSTTFCPQCGKRVAERPGSIPDAPLTDARSRFRRAIASQQGDDVADEEEIWNGSYSRLAMIGWWITASIATVVALVGGLLIGNASFWPTLGGVALGWSLLGARYAYRRLSVHYYLTTQRFIHETGILWRQTDRIELIDIDDVTFRQGPIEQMFSVGTIHLSSSDTTDPELDLPGIEGVREIAGMIDDLRRSERRRRGIHVEAV